MCARQRGVSSELVALLAPVEPIFDRLPGLVIGRDHFEVVISAYDPFLFVVGIDDGLHGDPVLSDLIRFDLGSSKPLEHCDPLQACGTLTAYHKRSGLDAQPPKCRHIRRSTTSAAPLPSPSPSEARGQAIASASLPSSWIPTFAFEGMGSGTLKKLPRRMFLSVSSRNPSSRRPP